MPAKSLLTKSDSRPAPITASEAMHNAIVTSRLSVMHLKRLEIPAHLRGIRVMKASRVPVMTTT
jgi:hypothetical protein